MYLAPLAHVKQRVLDWAEDGQDEGEADDVVDGVAEGGEEQVLVRLVHSHWSRPAEVLL